MHRVLIVDDHPLVRQGLSDSLNRTEDLCVCGEAEGLMSALTVVRETNPALVTIDLGLTDGSGLELIKEIKAVHPEVRILVLSMQDESLYAERCLRAGADGFIGKDEPPERILAAIRTVLAGRVHVSPEQASRMLNRAIRGRKESTSPLDLLTDRELEVFSLIGNGLTTRQIAEKLDLSPKTIESYRENIKSKLDLENAIRLQQRAVQWVIEKA
ncbi:MAG: response regulator transcription factor [Fuerstiella sp.]